MTTPAAVRRTHKVVCPHDCPDTCVMTVEVEGGTAVGLGGDPEHRFTQGFLCAKVNRYLERVYSPDRLLHPMKRVRSEEHTSELQSQSNLVCRLLLDPATTDIYTLSLHDALPICRLPARLPGHLRDDGGGRGRYRGRPRRRSGAPLHAGLPLREGQPLPRARLQPRPPAAPDEAGQIGRAHV